MNDRSLLSCLPCLLLLSSLAACDDHVRPSQDWPEALEETELVDTELNELELELIADEAEEELASLCPRPKDTGGRFEYRVGDFSNDYFLEAHFTETCVDYQVTLRVWDENVYDWSMQVDVCNRCEQPLWFEHYEPDSGHPLDLAAGVLDLTATLVDANGLTFFSECGEYNYGLCYPELWRQRTKLEPGESRALRQKYSLPFGGARFLPEFAHDGPLAVDVYLPRLWPETVPIEQRYPERARAILCALSGQVPFPTYPEYQPCVNTLELEPWSTEQLTVRRLQLAELPEAIRCNLDPACED
ncbi:MAG: hypothetical protein RBU37_24715 [Myxococcota bacterium]|nr:hypothetical protein [Myxococcota bacterium]